MREGNEGAALDEQPEAEQRTRDAASTSSHRSFLVEIAESGALHLMFARFVQWLSACPPLCTKWPRSGISLHSSRAVTSTTRKEAPRSA